MAKLLDSELNDFQDDSIEGKLFIRPPSNEESPEPLSQEWFRSHPQWTTDRLIKLVSSVD